MDGSDKEMAAGGHQESCKYRIKVASSWGVEKDPNSKIFFFFFLSIKLKKKKIPRP